MIETAWLAVWESSCSQGCRLVDSCRIPQRIARGEHIEAWKARQDGGVWCTDRQQTVYHAAIVDERHHIVGWQIRPVEDWRARRRRELAEQAERDAQHLAMARGEVRMSSSASEVPAPEVPARPATEDEVADCPPVASLVARARAAGWTVRVYYARGWAKARGSASQDTGGIGDGQRKRATKRGANFVPVDSLLVRGRRGERRFARAWSRKDAGWSASGAMLDGMRVGATEVGKAIKDDESR